MECIECGNHKLRSRQIELPGTVRGERFTVRMRGLECSGCGYKTIDGQSMPEYGRLLADQYRAAHGLLTSEEIKARRSGLGLSQAGFACLLGLGIASIKRWEMGKIQDERNDALIRRKTDRQGSNWFIVTHTKPVGGLIERSTLDILDPSGAIQIVRRTGGEEHA